MGKWWTTSSSGRRVRTKAGIDHEYKEFQSSAKAKSERASRNSARRAALKKGKVHRGDNLDVHHTNGVLDNSHIRIMPASKNRGLAEKSRLKRSPRKKRRE